MQSRFMIERTTGALMMLVVPLAVLSTEIGDSGR